jgi:hypothetical protein
MIQARGRTVAWLSAAVFGRPNAVEWWRTAVGVRLET